MRGKQSRGRAFDGFRLLPFLVLPLLGVTLAPTPGRAGARALEVQPTVASNVRQLTTLLARTPPQDPRISYDGTAVAYAAGINAFVVTTDATTDRQLTDVGGGSCGLPSPNSDGTRVAMVCTADLTSGNPDGNPEIFLRRGLEAVPITISPADVVNQAPWLSSDGTRLVFRSNGDYTGANADASDEVFLWRDGQPLQQITQTAGDAQIAFAFISGPGDRVLFGQTGAGGLDVFIYAVDAGTATPVLPDVPIGNGAWSRDGQLLVFETTADLTGTNLGGELKLYALPLDGQPRLLTVVPHGSRVKRLALNGSGLRIAAFFAGDTDAEVPLAPALLTTAGAREVLGVPADLRFDDALGDGVGIDRAGRVLAFASSADLTGENPDHAVQIFAALLQPGNANCDGLVTAADLPALVELVTRDDPGPCGLADATLDGTVNGVDVEVAIAEIFRPPWPARAPGGPSDTQGAWTWTSSMR